LLFQKFRLHLISRRGHPVNRLLSQDSISRRRHPIKRLLSQDSISHRGHNVNRLLSHNSISSVNAKIVDCKTKLAVSTKSRILCQSICDMRRPKHTFLRTVTE